MAGDDIAQAALSSLAASVSAMAASLEGVRVRLDEGNRRMETIERQQQRLLDRLDRIELALANHEPRLTAAEKGLLALGQAMEDAETAARQGRTTMLGVILSLAWQSVLTIWMTMRGHAGA